MIIYLFEAIHLFLKVLHFIVLVKVVSSAYMMKLNIRLASAKSLI